MLESETAHASIFYYMLTSAASNQPLMMLVLRYHRDGAWPGTVTIKGVDRWTGEVGRGRVGCNVGDFIDSPDNCAEGECTVYFVWFICSGKWM